jgi:hypothetical protein
MYREIRGPRRFEGQDLRAVLDHLSPNFRQALHAAADTYKRLGIRYALIGGVAASAYSRPRGTKDIDFLVGEEAFGAVGLVISFRAGVPQEACGVPIDNIPPPVKYREVYERALDGAVDSDEPGVLIARPEMLAFTKLVGARMRDVAAVAEMIEAETVDLPALAELVRPYPELRAQYNRAVAEWERSS